MPCERRVAAAAERRHAPMHLQKTSLRPVFSCGTTGYSKGSINSATQPRKCSVPFLKAVETSSDLYLFMV